MIVGSWHWTNCHGGYYGLSFGQAGMPLRGTAETRAAILGPWAYNIGVLNSLGGDFIPVCTLRGGPKFGLFVALSNIPRSVD